MDLYEKLLSGEEKLSLVGLGYVGMPIAVEFAKHAYSRSFCKKDQGCGI